MQPPEAPTPSDSTIAARRLASMGLYTALAETYDATYDELSYRRAYDILAWELISALLPPAAHVVDAGIGAGRWLKRLLEAGHRVTGIEQAPGMIAILQGLDLSPGFTLLRSAMEEAPVEPESADLVMALGSVQYAADPGAMIRRFAGWTKPGGHVCVYADSLVSLVLELVREGRVAEALERLATRRGVFGQGDMSATMHLYDRRSMEADFAAAGLVDIRCHGLTVGAGAVGRQRYAALLQADEAGTMATERTLAADPVMADLGLHVLTIGQRPE